MKRKYIIAAAAVLCCLTACKNNSTEVESATTVSVSENTSAESQATEGDVSESSETKDSNILITYFSVPETAGVDASSGAS